VNFFGHAAVAAWARPATPAFALGAMLPDFAAISGARSTRAVDDVTARGVSLHHATDEAFHSAADFVELMGSLRGRLEAVGLSRASAWASAHVAVELLLDGTLVADTRTGTLYLEALRNARSHLACAAEEQPLLDHFIDRMRDHGVPHGYADPRFVATRVERALARRPRLSLRPGQVDALGIALDDIAARVRARAPRLFADVRRRLPPEALCAPATSLPESG